MPTVTTDSLPTIDATELADVNGGAETWGESISNAWQGTRNFAGGATAGLLHGVNARTSQVSTFADTSSRATKAGFEMGAMGNMAAGPVGDLVGAGADIVNPAR